MRITISIICVIYVSFLSACAGKITQQNKNHMVNVSPDGDAHPVKVGKYRHWTNEVDDRFPWASTSNEYHNHVGAVINGIKNHNSVDCGECTTEIKKKKQILIFIHGGLNAFEQSIARVDNIYNNILYDKIYPVFINWRSGGLTTYYDYLFTVRDGEKGRASAKVTAPLYLGTDILGAFAVIPEAFAEQGNLTLNESFLRNDKILKETVISDSPAHFYYSESEKEDPLNSIGRSTLWLATSPFKLLTTPAVYSFGKSAWDIMNRRVKSMFFRPCEFYNNEFKCKETNQKYADSFIQDTNACATRSKSPFCSGALAVFLKQLREELCTHNNVVSKPCRTTKGIEYEITLIGHSMGAIVINNVLKYFPDIAFKNIVFMGAASTSRQTADSLVPYMNKHQNTDFYNISLHPLNEEREISAFGLLPSGSLLTWIDSMYGLPETEIDRTFGRWTNAKKALHLFPPCVANRMYFYVLGFKGNEPQYHGDFDDTWGFQYWNNKQWGKAAKKYFSIAKCQGNPPPNGCSNTEAIK